MANEHAFQPTADPAIAAHHCYEVLVVGAGPAGSSAAYHLARQGADVLLVDRFAFPRDKRCGDGIVTAALEELALMGIADEVQARYSVSGRVAFMQALSPYGEAIRARYEVLYDTLLQNEMKLE